MFEIYGIVKNGSDILIDTCETENEAESFCESWGWNYDDGSNSYYLYYLIK